MRTFALVTMFALAACTPRPKATPPAPTEVHARPVAGELPRQDPDAPAWRAAPEHAARTILQDQAEPKLGTPGVELVKVRALHDGKWIAFRLEWPDATRDVLAGPARFADAAAVQLPAEPGSDVTDAAMGLRGRPVRIHMWKATAEERLATKQDPVKALYPHAASDLPPGQLGPSPQPALDVLLAPARAVKNLAAVGRPDSPTQDLTAAGFGTLEPAPRQVSVGRGAHAHGAWRLTIAWPLDEGDRAVVRPGGRTYVAFAVWDGAKANVGSRKMRTGWIPLNVAAAPAQPSRPHAQVAR